jgi:hypothetical protein
MSDTDDKSLYLPSRKVISLDDERELSEKKKARPPGSKGSDFVTRDWALETFGKASVNIGQQMYDQVSGELADHLEQMELRLLHGIRAEIERRSFRGRLRMFLMRMGAKPKLSIEPRVVDPVEVLDPNSGAAVHVGGP